MHARLVTFLVVVLALGGGAVDAATVDVGALALQQTLSARAIGMAQTGTADPTDPLNSFLNPSLLPVREGVTGSYFHDEFLSNFISGLAMQGVNLAGMYEWHTGPSTVFAAGLQVHYARLQWPELSVPSSLGGATPYKPKEEYYGVTAAGEMRWASGFSAGAGVTLKSWSADYAGAVLNVDGAADASAYDVGGLVSYTTTSSGGWRTAISLGAAVVNNGDDFGDPTSFNASGKSALPQQTNYGLSVRTAGPMKRILDTEVPEVTFAFNADWRQPKHDESGLFGLGGEAAIMQVVFLRVGWLVPEHADYSIVQAGAGLGIPSRWFVVRVDYTAFPLELMGGSNSVDKRDKKFTIVFGVPFGPERR